jgi:vitamin B12 transporter
MDSVSRNRTEGIFPVLLLYSGNATLGFLCLAILLLFLSHPFPTSANEKPESASIETLLSLSLEELIEVEVEVASRRPTKLKYVAENISIITAVEISEMNAHSVNEILRTVTGVHIGFAEYFGGSGTNHIQTSRFEHVLILLDGVRVNEVGEGYTYTTGIPVQIIDRIEIVKGPASSAWGSALGGVINIITKSGGDNSHPGGTVYGSYGEKQSWGVRADAGGRSGKLRYYLYAGSQETDGLVSADPSSELSPDRWHESKNAYGKADFDLTQDVLLTFSAAYWQDRHLNIIIPELDWQDVFGAEDAYYVRGKLEAALSPAVKFKLNLYNFDNTFIDHYTVLGTGLAGNAGDFYQEYKYENTAYGGDISLTWDKDRHTMILGAEYYYGELKPWGRYGAYRQSQGFPPQEYLGGGEITNPAIYFNDTISWDRLTIIPGLRYDHLNISDIVEENQLSPSLGITYKITEDTLVRATAARGFTRPTITGTVGWKGRVPLPGNPDIESSIARSFQAGIESSEFEKLHLKADLFYHHLDGTFIFDADTLTYINGGVTKKRGFELNAIAGPFKNLTTHLGFTFVRMDELEDKSDDFYCLNAKFRYKNRRLGNIMLFGQFLWFGSLLESPYQPSYDDMIWDLHYNKDIITTEKIRTNFFFSVRNLFNGAHYRSNSFLNPDRWFEAGLRFHF